MKPSSFKNVLLKNAKAYIYEGYHLPKIMIPENYNSNKAKEELYALYQNIDCDKDEAINNYEKSITELKELYSDVNMGIIMDKYAKDYLMFNSRSYPTETFFLFLAVEIMKLINIECDEKEIDDKLKNTENIFARNLRYPILPKVKEYLGLKFNVKENYKYCNAIIDPIIYLLAYKEKCRYLSFFHDKSDIDLYVLLYLKLLAKN